MEAFWSQEPQHAFEQLRCKPEGLSSVEASERLRQQGPNTLREKKQMTRLSVFLNQFKSPIVLLLLFAAGLSWCLQDRTDAVIILTIVFASALLSFFQEFSAGDAVQKLLALVRTQVTALRDGTAVLIPLEAVVPGDIVSLNAGAIVPGDGLALETDSLFVTEAALTGETFPVEKRPGVVPAETGMAQRSNALFSGTNVVSGTGKMLVIHTGQQTEFGQIAERLQLRPPETEFERGIRRFGYLLIEFTLVLTLGVFAINVFLHKPVLDSFLFALALAVGLTPQLLPAIISVNLARGASEMARVKVIVKRLAAIENFGSMEVLCSDKTGTLTEGVVHVRCAYDPRGAESERVMRLARLNAAFQKGFANPIDEALLRDSPPDLTHEVTLVDELPYDFLRKRLSVLVQEGQGYLMITKGALEPVLAVCTRVNREDGSEEPLDTAREAILSEFATYSEQGLRVLGVAIRVPDIAPTVLAPEHEADMVFAGFLILEDPLRPDILETVSELRALGTRLKVITGDNRLVASHVGQQIGVSTERILTGGELRHLSDDALLHLVKQVDLFAEVEPNQKERLILAVKKSGFVVGYIGDGINDGAALHAADVGISVASAVDVAKEAADLVMLEAGLGVLVRGVQEGRKTFANTFKYVFMASSANFGNMFSMAGASLIMPFLPLLPKQILLMNLLTDLPEMTIATDRVDPELVEKPRRWDIGFLRRFMLVFGPVSSVFDFMTFGVLLLFKVSEDTFRTGWFTESIVSATLIVLVMRTRRPFFRSKPGRGLIYATVGAIVATLLLPYSPLAHPLGFVSLPPPILLAMLAIVAMYVFSAEVAKHWFYHREG